MSTVQVDSQVTNFILGCKINDFLLDCIVAQHGT